MVSSFFGGGGGGDVSPTLPAIAGQWVWLGDTSRERSPPVLPSIKALALLVWLLLVCSRLFCLLLVPGCLLDLGISCETCSVWLYMSCVRQKLYLFFHCFLVSYSFHLLINILLQPYQLYVLLSFVTALSRL